MVWEGTLVVLVGWSGKRHLSYLAVLIESGWLWRMDGGKETLNRYFHISLSRQSFNDPASGTTVVQKITNQPGTTLALKITNQPSSATSA